MNHALFRKQLLGLQTNLLNFAFTLTLNRDDAYDLLQDTTLKALDNEDRYTDNTNFKGWIFTIMRNVFINNYRRAVRTGMIVDTSDDLYQLNVPEESGTTSPEQSYAVKEINGVINTFSDEYRVPFNMHLAGYRYAEIAKEMHLPVGTVKSRIYYARQRLQTALADYDTQASRRR
ncbi:MAG: RNA polymerase sigma factor [Muribaculaceae bacterium]|nr:RNA polymerase sigma factor [Muribaculaceae bacterium]